MSKIKKILVPTDFSENAKSVYNFVQETAERYDAKVDLIHIIPRLSYLSVSRDALGNPFEDKDKYSRLREQLNKKLEKDLKEQIPEKNQGQTYLYYEHKPSEGIIAHAQKEKYDLIMIASRGRGESLFSRGSVTERLIRLANTPVLSVNKGYDPEIKTVLVPTDGSRVSLEALPKAILIAAQNNASIDLVSVSVFDEAKIKIAGRSSYTYTDEEIRESVINGLRAYVKEDSNQLSFKSELSPDGEVKRLTNKDGLEVDLSVVVEKGTSAHSAIVEYAEKNAHVVVMATQGRTGMKEFFIGSTAEKVFRRLKLPLLTVKPEFLNK